MEMPRLEVQNIADWSQLGYNLRFLAHKFLIDC